MTSTNPAEPAPHDEVPAESIAASPTPRRRGRTVGIVAAVTAATLVLGGGSVAAGAIVTSTVVRSAFGTLTPAESTYDRTITNRGGDGAEYWPGSSDRQSSASTSSTATAATAAQQVGVVTILTTIGYSDSAEAAGTGMVMTSDGLVLTNNHVIDGSTSIQVTVESTGETYTATVVGYDATQDVAVLQLQNASNLATVQFDTNDTTAIGDDVYSVGNAEGTGDLVTASGSVTAIDQSITVGNESTGASESLSGLIEVDSDVVSGDSGGPLFGDDGDVIGIITAASSGTSSIVGYAIDVDAALAVARQIESGVETATVQIGGTPFLGILLSPSSAASGTAGVAVGGTVAGMPAEAAGLVAGDTITAVDGAAVTSADSLSSAIAAHNVGDAVSIAWIDTAGASHEASVVLVAGPA